MATPMIAPSACATMATALGEVRSRCRLRRDIRSVANTRFSSSNSASRSAGLPRRILAPWDDLASRPVRIHCKYPQRRAPRKRTGRIRRAPATSSERLHPASPVLPLTVQGYRMRQSPVLPFPACRERVGARGLSTGSDSRETPLHPEFARRSAQIPPSPRKRRDEGSAACDSPSLSGKGGGERQAQVGCCASARFASLHTEQEVAVLSFARSPRLPWLRH